MKLATIARDLCVLTDWYTERPEGLTFRALGERYGMSESGAHQVVSGHRGKVAAMFWATEAPRLVRVKAEDPEAWNVAAVDLAFAVLEERVSWTVNMMGFADDRRQLARMGDVRI